MRRGGRPIVPAFAADEALFRRCDPEDIDTLDSGRLRILSRAFDETVALSAQRSSLAEPDHARWDSSADPGNPPSFVPQLHRDAYVVAVPVRAIPGPLSSGEVGSSTFQFEPVHKPFDDSYGHSEIDIKKNGATLTKKNQVNNKVKTLYRTILADGATVILAPGQVALDGSPPSPRSCLAVFIAGILSTAARFASWLGQKSAKREP